MNFFNLWALREVYANLRLSAGHLGRKNAQKPQKRARVHKTAQHCTDAPFILPPEGPARHLDVSGQKLSPHCLETIFDSQLPSPELSPKMPPKLSLPHRRGHFFLFQNYPCGEGNCEAIERQKLSRGNFCPGTSRCLAGPTGPPLACRPQKLVSGLSTYVLFDGFLRRQLFKLSLCPTVPEGHKHRVTTPENPRKIPRTPAEPRRDPAEPSERPRRARGETPAEPFERQISSESLAEGCAPRVVTLRNFRTVFLGDDLPPKIAKALAIYRIEKPPT